MSRFTLGNSNGDMFFLTDDPIKDLDIIHPTNVRNSEPALIIPIFRVS